MPCRGLFIYCGRSCARTDAGNRIATNAKRMIVFVFICEWVELIELNNEVLISAANVNKKSITTIAAT